MRIAALDDDVDQLDLVRCTLQSIGHDCHVFSEGAALRRELQRQTFDLLVLDWHLPDITGPELVRWIRANVQDRVPIIFVTNRNEVGDVVEGLSSGADDFMVKPMRVEELIARVRALLRRAYEDVQPDVQAWGRYRFTLASRQLEVDGSAITLTQKEFELALFLFRNAGRLVSRQHLLDMIWGTANPAGTDLMSRSLDTHVSRLRKLLGLRPERGYRLASIYGQGYRLEAFASDHHGAE